MNLSEKTGPGKKNKNVYRWLTGLLWLGFLGGIAFLALYVLAVSINFLYLFGPMPDLFCFIKYFFCSEYMQLGNLKTGKLEN
ncbi:MAG: hypothetical protein EOO03_07540 [Chitinophagaceae bacterium]|nr:MAG: hypothetical protein EOO03_07540 [Chitinophagaceae bacterium]